MLDKTTNKPYAIDLKKDADLSLTGKNAGNKFNMVGDALQEIGLDPKTKFQKISGDEAKVYKHFENNFK